MDSFFANVDWDDVTAFWRDCLSGSEPLPPFVRGDDRFGVTDLQALGRARAVSTPRPHTSKGKVKSQFLLRIGYDGTAYHGFQRQARPEPRGDSASADGGGADTVRTVEGELTACLGCTLVAAGRTDRVSPCWLLLP